VSGFCRYVLDLAAHDRQIAGVVAESLLLFIGKVMFLIDDDQAQVFQWCE